MRSIKWFFFTRYLEHFLHSTWVFARSYRCNCFLACILRESEFVFNFILVYRRRHTIQYKGFDTYCIYLPRFFSFHALYLPNNNISQQVRVIFISFLYLFQNLVLWANFSRSVRLSVIELSLTLKFFYYLFTFCNCLYYSRYRLRAQRKVVLLSLFLRDEFCIILYNKRAKVSCNIFVYFKDNKLYP